MFTPPDVVLPLVTSFESLNWRDVSATSPPSFSLFLPLRPTRDVDLVGGEAPRGVTCLSLIEYFDQKPCLICIEMIPLLVEKIRINWFPWDSRWKAFEAVQSRGVENVSKKKRKMHSKHPGNVLFEQSC